MAKSSKDKTRELLGRVDVSPATLLKEIAADKRSLQKLMIEVATGKEKNTSLVASSKRTIARLHTKLNQLLLASAQTVPAKKD